MPETKLTGDVGQKFDLDGSPGEFPGNTVICPTPRPTEILDLLHRLRGQAEDRPRAKKFS